jgi:hypothetical protein
VARNSHDFGIVMSFLQLKSEMDFATKKALGLFFLQMSRLQIVILIFSKTHKGISSPAFVSRQWNLDSIHKPFPMSSSAELAKTKNEFFGEISAPSPL